MARHPILQNFYASDRWIKFRLGLIAERGNDCQKCNITISRSKDIIGHHIIPLTAVNVSDVMISLNPDNILLVCSKCHESLHARFKPLERKVFIVYGPPLSGKTSYLTANVNRGDIVIDMDRLYEAVTLLPSHDKPDSLLRNVIGMYNLLIDNVKTRHGKWNNAYIVGGFADRYRREQLVNDLGAELVFIETPKEECLRRLKEDQRPGEYRDYIDKWFDNYTI